MKNELGDKKEKLSANYCCPENIDELVELHGGLVKSVALRLFKIYGEDLEDLIQIGYIGLIKAARGFDPSKGLAFSTYAVPTIAGEIRSELRDQGAIKVSRDLKTDAYKVRKAENEYMALHGISPRLSDIARETGLSQERVTEALQAADAMTNFEDFEKANLWTDQEERQVSKMDLMAGIKMLSLKQKQVIILRYFKDYTQKQVAEIMNISQVQVCRIEKSGLNCLSEMVKKDST